MPRDFCAATAPMEWSDADRDTVAGQLDGLERDAQLHRLFASAAARGFRNLLRFHHGAAYDIDAGRYRSTETSAWVSPKGNTVAFSDRYFANTQRDPFGAFSLQKQILLHELSHAGARGDWFQAVTAAAGWYETPQGWRVREFSETQWREIQRKNSEWQRLLGEGRVAEAYRLNREAGLALGFPSVYAFDSPEESFAKWVSYAALSSPDELARLRPEVVRALRETVLAP